MSATPILASSPSGVALSLVYVAPFLILVSALVALVWNLRRQVRSRSGLLLGCFVLGMSAVYLAWLGSADLSSNFQLLYWAAGFGIVAGVGSLFLWRRTR